MGVSTAATKFKNAGVPSGMPQASVSYQGESVMACTALRSTSASSTACNPATKCDSRGAKLEPKPK